MLTCCIVPLRPDDLLLDRSIEVERNALETEEFVPVAGVLRAKATAMGRREIPISHKILRTSEEAGKTMDEGKNNIS